MDKYLKEKSILKRSIPNRFQDVLESNNAIIAGGAITSIFSSDEINDYDLFFRTKNDRQRVLNYLNDSNDDTVPQIFYEYKEKPEIRKIYETETAITFEVEDLIVQVIVMDGIIDQPEKIIESFDFTISQGCYDFKIDEFIFKENFLKDLAQKKLVYTGSEYPIATLLRMKKFIKRGFDISGINCIKIGLDIERLNIKTIRGLREQLLGVDVMLLKDFWEQYDEGEREFQYEKFIQRLGEYLELQYRKEV